MSKFATAVAISLFFTASAHAATYYVATTGNDGNAGTLSAPFRTISKAAAVVAPGDVVNVRGGVYNGVVKIFASGTPSARIVFQSYAGETAIIDGTGTALNTNLVQVLGSYIDISGFEIRNSTRLGIAGWDAHNIRVMNNTVHSAHRGGIFFTSDAPGKVSDIEIVGNTVYNTALENQYHASANGWGQALSVRYATRTKIVGNKVYKNYGEGIDFILSSDGIAEGNEVYDNYSLNIYLDNAQGITVNGNLVYNTGDKAFYRGGRPAHGIGAANEYYPHSLPLNGLRITNNIVLRSQAAIYYGNYDAGGGLKSSLIAHNTIYAPAYAVLHFDSADHSGTVVENNIFHQAGSTSSAAYAGSGVTFRNNNWYGGPAGTAAGTGDVVGDPLFAKAGGTRAEDYRIGTLSRAIHAASASSAATTDYWGVQRTPSYDIGAHEFTLPLGSSSPATVLEVPTALDAHITNAQTVKLTWTGSAAAYNIYKNGAYLATVAASELVDADVLPATRYTYAVAARDSAGNESAQSNPVFVTTNTPDTAAPSVPLQLTANVAGPTSVALSWQASTDDDAVVGYRVYRDGVLRTTLQQLFVTDTGLTKGTSYTYQVSAVDAAGNESELSAEVSIRIGTSRRRAARP